MTTEHKRVRAKAFEAFPARRQNGIERAREERDRTIQTAQTKFERDEKGSNLAEEMERESWDLTHRAAATETPEI